MKNKLRAAALVAALALAVVSCGDNDSDSVNNPTLVGKWKYYGDYDAVDDELDVDDDDCYTATVQFKSNGKATYHETDCEDGYDDTDTFTWESMNANDTQIKVDFDGDADIMYVRYSANKDTLTIQDAQDDLSGEVYLRQ